jgi:hypothetical protein
MVEIVTAALNCIVQSMQKLAKGMDIWWEFPLSTDTYFRFNK